MWVPLKTRELGEGGWGKVYLCRLRNSNDGKLYAVKRQKRFVAYDDAKWSSLGREIAMNRSVEETIRDDEKAGQCFVLASAHLYNRGLPINGSQLALSTWMAMPFVLGLDLRSIIEIHDSHLPMSLVISILVDVLDAMAVLHGNHIAHGDVFPRNIILDFSTPLDPEQSRFWPRAKLADFGMAVRHQPDCSERSPCHVDSELSMDHDFRSLSSTISPLLDEIRHDLVYSPSDFDFIFADLLQEMDTLAIGRADYKVGAKQLQGKFRDRLVNAMRSHYDLLDRRAFFKQCAPHLPDVPDIGHKEAHAMPHDLASVVIEACSFRDLARLTGGESGGRSCFNWYMFSRPFPRVFSWLGL